MALPSPISAIPRNSLASIQRGTMRYTWRGVLCNKNPFDLALYLMLLWQIKPATIIEIGSKEGGSALWLWQTCSAFHIKTRIISVDINQRARIKHPHITFLEGDGRNLCSTLSDEMMRTLRRPLLVIEDADHHYLTTLGVLRFMDGYLHPGEYILVEDGICDSFGNEHHYDGGPNRAIAEFLDGRSDYEVDRHFCDFFGHNVTWNTNGYIRRLAVAS
jgi:cephalosporin hydroxylase